MILDVTCGARLMWHNKHHPGVIYADQRATHHQLSDGRQITISPNIQCDYRALCKCCYNHVREHRSGNDTLDNYPLYADQEK